MFDWFNCSVRVQYRCNRIVVSTSNLNLTDRRTHKLVATKFLVSKQVQQKNNKERQGRSQNHFDLLNTLKFRSFEFTKRRDSSSIYTLPLFTLSKIERWYL